MSTFLQNWMRLRAMSGPKGGGGPVLPPVGIAAYENGERTYYTLAEWNALAVKPTPMGVFLNDGDTRLILHQSVVRGEIVSSPVSGAITGVEPTQNLYTAMDCFNGESQTRALVAAVNNNEITSSVVASLQNLSFPDDSFIYTPALGELLAIQKNIADINSCRDAIGQSQLVFSGDFVGSSTLYPEQLNLVALLYSGSVDMYGRTVTLNYYACAKL